MYNKLFLKLINQTRDVKRIFSKKLGPSETEDDSPGGNPELAFFGGASKA